MKLKRMRISTFIAMMIIAISGGLIFQSCEKSEMSSEEAFYSEFDLKASVLTEPCKKEVCLVAGQHMYVGTVEVSKVDHATGDGYDIYVKYKISVPNVLIKEVHLDIFTNLDQLTETKPAKANKGGANPGQFEYKIEFKDDYVADAEIKVDYDYIMEVTEGQGDCFFIGAHAALDNGETAWGGICEPSDKGVRLDPLKKFGNNWSTFFEFCPDECETAMDWTYAWEDMNINGSAGNDGDYNDLVVQSDIIKSDNELNLFFFATARGAAYDHAFKIRIPKAGIIEGGIFGAKAIVEDGTDFILTVFESTKALMPAEGWPGAPWAANTAEDDPNCDPYGEAAIVILINEDYIFTEEFPYDPYITVHPGTAKAYDLNIWELHKTNGGNTWVDDDKKEYPNGILVNDDWLWPLEEINIAKAYDRFKDISIWDDQWAKYLTDDQQVFSVDCDYDE